MYFVEYTINYFCVFPVLRNIRYIKKRTGVKFSIVPEEGWFGQPKYSTPSKNHPTLCRFLLFYSYKILALQRKG